MDERPFHYLSGGDVTASLPDIEERLRLAERVMVGLAEGAQLPAKIGVEPGPVGSFAHAMPALMRGDAPDGSADLLGMKWVLGFPRNPAIGLPAVTGTTLLNDARTGQLRAVVDAAALTAHRTAAVSGLVMRRWGPAATDAPRVAIVGAGAQARSHLPVIAHLLPGATIVLCDQDRGRAEALVAEADEHTSGLGAVRRLEIAADPYEAAHGADVVLTMVSFGPTRQSMAPDAFAHASLVVAVDYDMCVPASIALRSSRFLVDHREQYLANRTTRVFVGYPDDPMTIGEAIRGDLPRPDGPVLVTHLGVGLADVVFADAVLRVARERGIGTILPR